jgi:hypothetical protein
MLRLWTTFALVAITVPTTALGVTLQKFKESPGLYYCYHVAQLYKPEWKLLTNTDLQEADRNLETVVRYAQLSKNDCKNHEHC